MTRLGVSLHFITDAGLLLAAFGVGCLCHRGLLSLAWCTFVPFMRLRLSRGLVDRTSLWV